MLQQAFSQGSLSFLSKRVEANLGFNRIIHSKLTEYNITSFDFVTSNFPQSKTCVWYFPQLIV